MKTFFILILILHTGSTQNIGKFDNELDCIKHKIKVLEKFKKNKAHAMCIEKNKK